MRRSYRISGTTKGRILFFNISKRALQSFFRFASCPLSAAMRSNFWFIVRRWAASHHSTSFGVGAGKSFASGPATAPGAIRSASSASALSARSSVLICSTFDSRCFIIMSHMLRPSAVTASARWAACAAMSLILVCVSSSRPSMKAPVAALVSAPYASISLSMCPPLFRTIVSQLMLHWRCQLLLLPLSPSLFAHHSQYKGLAPGNLVVGNRNEYPSIQLDQLRSDTLYPTALVVIHVVTKAKC